MRAVGEQGERLLEERDRLGFAPERQQRLAAMQEQAGRAESGEGLLLSAEPQALLKARQRLRREVAAQQEVAEVKQGRAQDRAMRLRRLVAQRDRLDVGRARLVRFGLVAQALRHVLERVDDLGHVPFAATDLDAPFERREFLGRFVQGRMQAREGEAGTVDLRALLAQVRLGVGQRLQVFGPGMFHLVGLAMAVTRLETFLEFGLMGCAVGLAHGDGKVGG